MTRTDKRMRLCAALLACNLVVIWGNSMLPGNVSGAISDFVRDIAARILPMSPEKEAGGHFIRKLAHFTEFTALGVLLCWLFSMLKKPRSLALALGVGAASLDETIQRFVPGRVSSLKDVGIDTCGVLAGILLLRFGYAIYQKKRKHLEERQ